MKKAIFIATLVAYTSCSLFASQFQQQAVITKAIFNNWRTIAGISFVAATGTGFGVWAYLAGYGLKGTERNAWNEALQNKLSALTFAQKVRNLKKIKQLRSQLSSTRTLETNKATLNQAINNAFPELMTQEEQKQTSLKQEFDTAFKNVEYYCIKNECLQFLDHLHDWAFCEEHKFPEGLGVLDACSVQKLKLCALWLEHKPHSHNPNDKNPNVTPREIFMDCCCVLNSNQVAAEIERLTKQPVLPAPAVS